jgi:hypothetical protein
VQERRPAAGRVAAVASNFILLTPFAVAIWTESDLSLTELVTNLKGSSPLWDEMIQAHCGGKLHCGAQFLLRES